MFLVINAGKTVFKKVIIKNYCTPHNPPSYDENGATFSSDYCSVYLLWYFLPIDKQGIWVDGFLITFQSHIKLISHGHMEKDGLCNCFTHQAWLYLKVSPS